MNIQDDQEWELTEEYMDEVLQQKEPWGVFATDPDEGDSDEV